MNDPLFNPAKMASVCKSYEIIKTEYNVNSTRTEH